MSEESFALTNSLSTTAAFGRDEAAFMGLKFSLPSGATGVMTFYALDSKTGTFLPLLDETGAAVTLPSISAACWINAPVAVAIAPWFKIVLANNVTVSVTPFRGA
jgi:hypothetical protein